MGNRKLLHCALLVLAEIYRVIAFGLFTFVILDFCMNTHIGIHLLFKGSAFGNAEVVVILVIGIVVATLIASIPYCAYVFTRRYVLRKEGKQLKPIISDRAVRFRKLVLIGILGGKPVILRFVICEIYKCFY